MSSAAGFSNDDLSSTVQNKQAAIVAIFMLYLIYTVTLFLKYLMQHKERTADEENFDNFTNDVIYRGFFFIFLAMVGHI